MKVSQMQREKEKSKKYDQQNEISLNMLFHSHIFPKIIYNLTLDDIKIFNIKYYIFPFSIILECMGISFRSF